MPTYQFRCPVCAEVFDEKRGFARADDPARCPSCGSDGASKLFASAMFFSPGSAAKAILEPKAPSRAVPVAAGHGSDCPCCGGRRPA